MPISRTLPLVLAAVLMAPALPAMALEGVAGSYLAGRHAQITSDYRNAAGFMAKTLMRDPGNMVLMEDTMTAFLALGQVDRAAPIARQVAARTPDNQIANMILLGELADQGDWPAVLDTLADGRSVGPLFDGLLRAWALLGRGETDEALAGFDKVAEQQGVSGFGRYHKALAQAAAGDYAGALETLDEGDGVRLARRGLIAKAQMLSQTGANDAALAVLNEGFGGESDPTLDAMRATLEAGETLPYDTVPTPRAGVAEIFHSIADALRGEANAAYTLLYARMADYLRPDHVESLLLTAGILEELDQYDLATEVFRKVPREHPAFPAAELGRADVMRQAGQTDAAIEVMRQLADLRPELTMVHVTLGDTLRGEERYEEARDAYDRAVGQFETEQPGQWVVYFARGIASERLGDWDLAEADFRRALALNEGQPQVLNYLGYSLVERREKLDEALEMIERAVAARPDSGYIADSLGWVLYRLDRYEEAVAPMERAVELMPVDPVVNDHLGDVYWAVGRKLEARFQWKRALSFVDNDQSNEVKPDRIRRKLEVGLDKVLEEEGAAPLKLANDG